MICKYCDKEIMDGSVFCNYCGRKQIREKSARKRANGEGCVYKRYDTYTAMHSTWRNGKRITHSKGGFKTKKEAYSWLSANSVMPTAKEKDILVSKLYERWSAVHYKTISKKKAQSYSHSFDVMKDIHNLWYTDELNLQLMQNAVDCSTPTHACRKLCKNVLQMMEDYANKHGFQERHIAQYIVIPKEVKPTKNPFTMTEIETLEKAYGNGDTFAGYILILIYTGMRHCELKQLKPENIHIDDGYLIGGQKTEAGRLGEIIISDKIKPMLKEFTDHNPVSYSDTTFKKNFDECLKRNGISQHTPHECRHTFATLLNNAGVNALTMKELMRHTSVAHTQAYVHSSRKELQTAIEKTSLTGGLK